MLRYKTPLSEATKCYLTAKVVSNLSLTKIWGGVPPHQIGLKEEGVISDVIKSDSQNLKMRDVTSLMAGEALKHGTNLGNLGQNFGNFSRSLNSGFL